MPTDNQHGCVCGACASRCERLQKIERLASRAVLAWPDDFFHGANHAPFWKAMTALCRALTPQDTKI